MDTVSHLEYNTSYGIKSLLKALRSKTIGRLGSGRLKTGI
jgi:hypothetical protein